MKDELLCTGHATDTLERLVIAACEIDNTWYERSIECKGKYNPDYKRIGEGKYRNYRNNNSRGYKDLMELDITIRSPILDSVCQKHITDRMCFNCGKPGHMAYNCKLQRGKPGHRGHTESRMQLNTT